MYRSYIGHKWAIHKLYISHVQPTVQATYGPYPYLGSGWRLPPPFSPYLLWSICGLYYRLYMTYVQLMYGPYMAYVWHLWPIYGPYIWPCMGILPVFLYGPSYPAGVFEHAHLVILDPLLACLASSLTPLTGRIPASIKLKQIFDWKRLVLTSSLPLPTNAA